MTNSTKHPAASGADLPARIKACVQAGETAAAFALAQQLSQLDPNNAISWVTLAQTLVLLDRKLEAAEAYERAFSLNPSKIYAISQWYYLGYTPRRAAKMLATLRSFLGRDDLAPPAVAVLSRFATTLAEEVGRGSADLPMVATSVTDLDRRFSGPDAARWLEASRAWLEMEPNSPDAAENVTYAIYAANAFVDMTDIVSRIRQNAREKPAAAFITDASFFAAAAERTIESIISGLPPTRILAQSFEGGDRAIFVGCDQSYFDHYVLALIGSLVLSDPHTTLHIHVFDPDETRLLECFATMTSSQPIRLRISVEHAGTTDDTRATYAHAIRYVRFAQYSALYPAQLWMMDADTLCLDHGFRLFDLLDKADLACSFFPARIEPHNRILAWPIGIGGESAGRLYLKLVAAYLMELWRTGWLRWGADQAALYFIFLYLRGTARAPRLKPLPANCLSTSDAEGAFASVKDSSQNPMVLQLRRAGLQAIGLPVV